MSNIVLWRGSEEDEGEDEEAKERGWSVFVERDGEMVKSERERPTEKEGKRMGDLHGPRRGSGTNR